MKPINVGNGHTIMAERVLSVIKYGSRPTIQLKKDFEHSKKVINLSGGEKIKSLILTDGGFLFLSSVTSQTITERIKACD